MTVRNTMLCTVAIAAALLSALPATARGRDSSPSERAQTEALNADAVDRAHGNAGADRASDRFMGHRDGDGRSNNTIMIDFGAIAFGYSDGYWDTGRRWHAWRNADEARDYRNHHGSNYRDRHHDRYRDNGWRR